MDIVRGKSEVERVKVQSNMERVRVQSNMERLKDKSKVVLVIIESQEIYQLFD